MTLFMCTGVRLFYEWGGPSARCPSIEVGSQTTDKRTGQDGDTAASELLNNKQTQRESKKKFPREQTRACTGVHLAYTQSYSWEPKTWKHLWFHCILCTIVYYCVLLCTVVYYCVLLCTIMYYFALLCTIVYGCVLLTVYNFVLLCTTLYYCVPSLTIVCYRVLL